MEFACKWLKPGGRFLVKLFQGEGFEGFLKLMQARFRKVVVRKPGASRDRSSETYLLGSGPQPHA
jgi:23S rRNA (uridine2552-2'-O)-methyltransferase